MKNYKFIGLSILLTIFIVANFMASFSFKNETNSSIEFFANQAIAQTEEYGNGQGGWCATCYLVVGGEIVGEGMKINCYTSPNHLCISQSCGYGFC